MSEDQGCTVRPSFKAKLKKNFDVHVPLDIIEVASVVPGDYLNLEVIPVNEPHDSPFTKAHEMEAKQRIAEADEVGTNTFNYFLPLWMGNFKEHLLLTEGMKRKSINDIPTLKTPKFGIVVGAGPSLHKTTKAQWEALRNFDGVVVATNKTLVPLLKRGVVPQWVVALDGDAVVMNSFRDEVVGKYAKKVNFMGPTVLHTEVVDFALKWAKECYWGNPHMPSGHDSEHWNINVVLELMNGLPVLRHGGNVGTCAWLLAKQLGCNPIGMYGFDLCVHPDKTWTREAAVNYEYFYNPDNGELLALGPAFRAYFSVILGATDQAWNEDPPVKTVNLTPKGTLYMTGFIPNFTIEEFVKKKGVAKRATEEREKNLAEITRRLQAVKDATKPIFRDDF